MHPATKINTFFQLSFFVFRMSYFSVLSYTKIRNPQYRLKKCTYFNLGLRILLPFQKCTSALVFKKQYPCTTQQLNQEQKASKIIIYLENGARVQESLGKHDSCFGMDPGTTGAEPVGGWGLILRVPGGVGGRILSWPYAAPPPPF